MAKYHGEIGFSETKEIPEGSGLWREAITKRRYYGTILRNTFKNEESEYQNKNINVSNRFSIVADTFMRDNFSSMRCLSWMGVLWEITSIDVQYPRLIISIGGVYNEQTT